MIQRLQTLLLFFSSLCIIVIVYSEYFPIYRYEEKTYFLKMDDFLYARLCLVFSAALSVLAIFQFKNRKDNYYYQVLLDF